MMGIRRKKIKVGVSQCLLGDRVRYDGGHKRDPYIVGVLGKWFEWVPVCPEAEAGMGVPREPVRLEGNPRCPRLKGVITGQDWTRRMRAYAVKRLKALARENLCGFIFKSKSPSSGLKHVRIHTADGKPNGYGRGLIAGLFLQRFPLIPVIDESCLQDPRQRKIFIQRVLAYAQLQNRE